jgi:acyl-CoA synthetase (NDP forming)
MVLLKGGSGALGAAAAASHTGALAGEDAALDAFLERQGILRARDIHELVNAAALFEHGFPVREGRTVVMSHSGAVGVLCADAAERVGLRSRSCRHRRSMRSRRFFPASRRRAIRSI